MSFVTFIIPSMNRSTLYESLTSLLNQTNKEWEAIVIFDGIAPHEVPLTVRTFPQTKCIFQNKIGHAGLLRNIGFLQVTTPWIAFLDDDDVLAKTYVESLKKHEKDHDVIIHTLKLNNGDIHPKENMIDFSPCNVGISFAVKRAFRNQHQIEFKSGEIEDFDFLDKCRKAGAKYTLTHEIQYYASARNFWKKDIGK